MTEAALSSASFAPWSAICSIWRLFSAFWVIDALICSSEDVVSSTEAACSLVPCDTTCAEADTWLEAESTCPETATTWDEAPVTALARPRTSPMISARRSTNRLKRAAMCPISSRLVTGIRRVRSPPPWTICSRWNVIADRGAVTARVTTSATPIDTTRQIRAMRDIAPQRHCWLARAAANAVWTASRSWRVRPLSVSVIWLNWAVIAVRLDVRSSPALAVISRRLTPLASSQ